MGESVKPLIGTEVVKKLSLIMSDNENVLSLSVSSTSSRRTSNDSLEENNT